MSKVIEKITEIRKEKSNKSRDGSNKNITLYTKDGAKVLTNGKVYRNLFDSEVQLINALERIRSQQLSKINVIILPQSEKQFSKYKILPPNISKEVSLLPENVVTNKNQSDLIAKVVQSRKKKFDNVLINNQEDIGSINDRTSEAISNLSRILNENYTNISAQIDEIIDNFECKELISLFRNDFTNLSESLLKFQNQKLNLINEYYQNALDLEKTRIKQIIKSIASISFELERIGHIPPSDVHRLIAQNICDLNVGILENRQSFCDIKTKLMMLCINEDRKYQIYLKNKIAIWRETTTNHYIKDLEHRLKQEESEIVNNLNASIENVNPKLIQCKNRIEAVFREIKENINPEVVTEVILDKWNEQLAEIKQNIDTTTEEFFKSQQIAHEITHTNYLADMQALKDKLMTHQVFEDVSECNSIVDNQILPVIGSIHKSYESKLEQLEIIVDKASKEMNTQNNKIYTVINSLLVIWKVHVKSLDKIEESIYQKLKNGRDTHQQLNLNMENELNAFIDELRQDSNENTLKDNLRKCVNFLDKIKTSYQQFNAQQITTVKRYPNLIETELKKLNDKLKENFNSKKTKIKKLDEEEIDTEIKPKKNKTKLKHELKMEIISIVDESIINLWKDIEKAYEIILRDWEEKLYTNARKVITTKTEEFDSELKLRLHLHDPRYRRIEYDVHNVRIAELTIHNERVNRQIRHVENMLATIRQEYINMDTQQKSRQDTFKTQFLALEDASIDVSSQSKLQNIRRKLDNQCTAYMKNLRTALREFRSNVETRLQNIRKLNADFVCSFKLFSEGGNFSPEEIDNFSKKIEKINQKVDEVEGEIMSNLETVEKQQNDFVINLKTNFEEKFKHHIIDIGFLEKLTRSMAELQIQIKSEVSNSNSHSKEIFLKIKELYQQLQSQNRSAEQCLITKEYINRQIFQLILSLFSAVNDRSIYLDCLRTQKNPQKLQAEFDPTALANKVQFSSFNKTDKINDVGPKTIKEILKLQNEVLQTPKDKSKPLDSHEESEEKNTSSSRRNSIKSEPISTNTKQGVDKSKTINKAQLQEKRNLVFGEPETDIKPTFLNKVRNYCRSILDGIQYAAELFYRHKGQRRVTQAGLEDNLDQAIDNIIMRMKGYYQQAEEYRNECLKEFNKQLKDLENVINMFPSIVYSNIEATSKSLLTNQLQISQDQFNEKLDLLNKQKSENSANLRPYLGSPDNKLLLDQLSDKEQARITKESEENNYYIQTCKQTIYEFGRQFVKDLTTITEEMFLLMDNLLTTLDVINAEEKVPILNVNGIMRQKFTTSSNEKKEDPIQEKGTWVTKDLNEIIQANPDTKTEQMNFSLITSKSTSSHLTILNQRALVVENYKKFYFDTLQDIEKIDRQLDTNLDSYKTYWNVSVKNLIES